MNLENLIEYIRRGVGLRITKVLFWTEAVSFTLISGGLMLAGKSAGGFTEFLGTLTFAASIIHLICTFFFVRKNSPVKNKLLAGGTSCCLLTCFFAFIFNAVLCHFGLQGNGSINVCYILLILIPVIGMLFYALKINNSKHLFSKNNDIKTISVSKIQGNIALGKLILGIVVIYLGNVVTDAIIEMIFFCGFVFIMCFLPTGVLDFQRYYYFSKLEKMGLVTEDVLKPEE